MIKDIIFLNPVCTHNIVLCHRYQLHFVSPGLIEGSVQRDITDIFRNGWSAGEKGAYLEFTFRGTGAAVQYRRVKDGPAPIATAVVDENPANSSTLRCCQSFRVTFFPHPGHDHRHQIELWVAPG